MQDLTIDEAAERLGVSVRTLRRWIHAGRLRASRTELGAFRINPDDLEAARDRRVA